MARAFWNDTDQQWVADFRPLGGVMQQRRRVRLDRAKFPKKAASAAHAFAGECERYCRALEIVPQDPADIEHATRIKAITDDQAARLRSEAPEPIAPKASRRWTIREAAEAHPSTQRDLVSDKYHALTYLRALEKFCEFSGRTFVSEITLTDALRYVEHMRRERLTYHARKHRFLYLRRACRMAATVGLPDVLSGFRLDRMDEDAPPISAYSLDELGVVLRAAAANPDPRYRLAVALGGFLGDRPSESYRANVGDLDGAVRAIGKRKAKNRSSRRTLPMPPTVVRWWHEVAGERAPDEPLFVTESHRRVGRFSSGAWSRWLGDFLEEASGRDFPAKTLRKSFSTWGSRPRWLGADVERFMGHQSAFLAPVTSAAYLGEVAAEELRPAARIIERAIRACLHPPRRVATKSQRHAG